MTAINTFVRESGVYFVVDGATYLPAIAGNPAKTGRMTKVQHLPWLGAAFAITGPATAAVFINPMIGDSHASTFDGFLAEFPQLLKNGVEEFKKHGQQKVIDPAEIVVAGWSDKNERYEAYAIATYGHNQHAPYTLRPVTKYMRPYPSTATWATFEPEHAERDGMRILDLQRASCRNSTDGDLTGAIGGFAQLAHLTRDGMTSKLIGVFEDAAALIAA